jgi:protein phosphatase
VDGKLVKISWEAAGATHRGRVRRGNEDAIRLDVERGIFLVADGMGGHAAGEIASNLAADAVLEHLSAEAGDPESRLREGFSLAHRSIAQCCQGDPKTTGMGTTLTATLLDWDGRLHVGHIGDSRLYHLTGGALRQVTHDHTWVQREVDAGRVSAASAASHPFSHILTRVLAAEEPPDPDLLCVNVVVGDVLLLCSDGLHNMLNAQAILDMLIAETDPGSLVRQLVMAANAEGGTDNISVVAVRIHP